MFEVSSHHGNVTALYSVFGTGGGKLMNGPTCDVKQRAFVERSIFDESWPKSKKNIASLDIKPVREIAAGKSKKWRDETVLSIRAYKRSEIVHIA